MDELWCFVFRHPGYLRVRSLVLARCETPKYETPKRYSVTRIYCFGVSAPKITRGKSLVLASPEILTCETPKWPSVSRVWMFQSFGTRETQMRDLLSSRSPKSRLTKSRNDRVWTGYDVSEFRLSGNPGARPPVITHPEIPMEETPK
jgi:hypothetical protein